MTTSWTGGGSVRPADLRDLDAILVIESQAFEPLRRSSRTALRRALRSAFQRTLVLEVDGEVAGYLVLWPYRRTWRIYNLATAPRRRGQGIGTRLVDAAAGAAERAGASRLVLESRLAPELVRFYEQRGFRARRTLPNYYAEGEDAVRMELPLPR